MNGPDERWFCSEPKAKAGMEGGGKVILGRSAGGGSYAIG
jgi:hypothetical protein